MLKASQDAAIVDLRTQLERFNAQIKEYRSKTTAHEVAVFLSDWRRKTPPYACAKGGN